MTFQRQVSDTPIESAFPDLATNGTLAAQVLDEGLDACANILARMRSCLDRQGGRSEAEDAGVLLKSATSQGYAAGRPAQLQPSDRPGSLVR